MNIFLFFLFFLSSKVALVEQQSKLFQTYLGNNAVIGLSGESAHGPLKPILDAKSVLVMTAQILVNGLQDHTVELSHIGLLILDECHNCQVRKKNRNKINDNYMYGEIHFVNRGRAFHLKSNFGTDQSLISDHGIIKL